MAKGKDDNDGLVEAKKAGRKPTAEVVDLKEYVEKYLDITHDAKIKEGKEKSQQVDLERMNTNHAFIHSLGGKSMVLCWVYNEVFKCRIAEFRSADSICLQYGNRNAIAKDRDEVVPLGKWWLAHPERRDYTTVIFDPEMPPGPNTVDNGDEVWNLWEGFGVKEKEGDWSKTKNHILKILCNNDQAKYSYFMKWMAFTVQKPGTRAEVAVAFKGKKGAGKGFIFTQLREIFGRHGLSISNTEHLTGKHNEHLMQCCFLFADEAFYPGDKGGEGVLKQLITEPYLSVEPKFQKTRLAINCLHIGMSTNNDWFVAASSDERRFFINTVEPTYAKGVASDVERDAYFTPLWAEMDNGGREAMLHELKNMDLGKWHPRKDVPDTSELKEQMFMSMGRKEKLIQKFLEVGIFPGSKQGDVYVISARELEAYFNRIDPQSKVPLRHKGDMLKKLGAKSIRTRDQRMWEFPTLGDMKKAFNRELIIVDWDDYEDWELERRVDY